MSDHDHEWITMPLAMKVGLDPMTLC